VSEYQYHEFVAVDRALTHAEQDALREVSSRARITAHSFVNVYNYGDLRADPTKLLARYFDARVYDGNFGQREFAVRLPRGALDPRVVVPYLRKRALELTTTREHAVLTFIWSDEEGSGWVDESDSAAWLRKLLPLREQLLRGELAALYVAWLHGVEEASAWDNGGRLAARREPLVPAGLGAKNAALGALCQFLEVDADLLAAAAEQSPVAPAAAPAPGALAAWLAARPSADKDAWLARVAAGDGARVEAELQRAFAASTQPRTRAAKATQRRTFEELEARAAVLAAERDARKSTASKRASRTTERLQAATSAKPRAASASKQARRGARSRP
jgi:hypothetical protein